MKFLTFILLAVGLAFPAQASLGQRLREMPVQDNGRLKPYDTFAQETLEIVYGKKSYEGHAAWEVVLTWMLAPQVWGEKELFEVRNTQIQKALGLDEHRRWYKGQEVFGKERFPELMSDLKSRRESKEKLTPYFQALQRLESQFFVFREMAVGQLMRIMPVAGSDTWLSVAELQDPARGAFADITQKFVGVLSYVAGNGPQGSAAEAAVGGSLDRAVDQFEQIVHSVPGQNINIQKLQTEVFFNDFHPFRWAYIFYLIAALCGLMGWIANKDIFYKGAWAFTGFGFIVHIVGFGLRVYLAGRPPVSNMYETVVWVAFGGVLFSAILEMVYRQRFILLAGNIAGFVALVIADTAPVVLDPSLQPLEAVLRSNYWLIIHVMTITISYAAFFLAFVLGDIALLSFLKDPADNQPRIKALVQAIYRCIQIGVALLAPGIILGGIWADYSWGRFWGWDPKETWALIVLLGYLAVLHGRLTNWIKDFGLVVCAVATFSLVVMCWYGVNFVLGAGLHSYGFGAGGVEYVTAIVVAHWLLLLYVGVLHRGRKSV